MDWVQKVAVVSGVLLPLFNIPLILRMRRRKSSSDLSLSWALGVWICVAFMTPQALRSPDLAFRAYGILNILFFTVVVIFVLKYRK